MPELEDGLRARSAFLASAFTGYVSPAVRLIDAGEEVTLDGTTVWLALTSVDPRAADAFWAAVGGPKHAPSSRRAMSETSWIYNPQSRTVRMA